MITIENFQQIELRVATILSAERIEGADRILKLQIDLGTEQRQLVAGIARVYSPDELIGKQIVVVVNLQPAVIRGVESQGMLLAASCEDASQLAIISKT
ncbi:methionine--tRNA ligase subunit beta [Candidatus Acetothermia bacterium]|nr:methionine--tRNA ligase subunit beta [Candidatus Acetothermia bacterium]